MADSKNVASKRIPIKEDTLEHVRDFSNGLSATYDEALEFLLSRVMKPGEDALTAGRRLREEYNSSKGGAQ